MDEIKKQDEPRWIDPKAVEVLITNIIPTSKYIESRFDGMQTQINEINTKIKDLKDNMEVRFNIVNTQIQEVKDDVRELKKDIDKRFEQVDKRFEQVDKRFEQVDKRFEQIDEKLDKIIERIDRRIDEGLRENRSLIIRLFTFAMTFSAISMIGLMGKIFRLF